VALSGGVAPGYHLVPLQGTTNLPFGLTPRHPVSVITDSRFPLWMLRMTQGGVNLYAGWRRAKLCALAMYAALQALY